MTNFIQDAAVRFQQTRTTKSVLHIMSVGVLALGLSACGGDDSSSDDNSGNPNPNPNPEQTVANFSESATWEIDGAATEACYDIDTQQQIDCTANVWDVKFENKNRTVNLWTNSGISGDGDGAAFYLGPWSDISELNNAQEVPAVGFKPDSGAGVFKVNPWYAYNLNGQHKLAPNNRVYLVTTDANEANTTSTVNKPVYALQLINYYNDAGQSGYPTVRWIDTAMPNQVQTKTMDASEDSNWVYLNLATGETTTKEGEWQIAFNRYNVVLNGGDSGSKNVGGYLAKTPDGYYDDNGEPIKAKFAQDNTTESLADLTMVSAYDISSDGVPWVKDSASSPLNPEASGSYPTIDYGWFVYKANEGHRLFAKPEGERLGGLIRSGEGNSYARFYLEDIVYADATATTPSKWVYKFEIQPATN